MAAVLIDERQEDETEEVVQQEAQQEQPVDDLPEKYRNKSVKEIVQMHQEAEKLAGRQSSEVGELRKVVDDFILNQTTQLTKKEQPKEVTEIDFFTDPESAVSRAVQKALENDPRIKEAQGVSIQQKKDRALAALQKNHADMPQILQDQKFNDWVQNSKFRVKLYEQADRQFDAEAADELLTLWKERQSVTQQAVAVEQQARKQAVKSAATSGARGTAETDTRKIYRRQDIITLMKENPDRYQAMSEEIMRAYAENRVRG